MTEIEPVIATEQPSVEQIAQAANETLGEAYRSPHTLQSAREAARIALRINADQQGEQ